MDARRKPHGPRRFLDRRQSGYAVVVTCVLCALLSACMPGFDTFNGTDLSIISLDIETLPGRDASFALVGSATENLTDIRWYVAGTLLPGTGLGMRVRFDQPGSYIVTVRANSPSGPRNVFKQVTVVLPARPRDTPDVVVFAFSGRCGPICHPEDNRANWTTAHLMVLQDAIARAGLTIHISFRNYRAHVYDHPLHGAGFLRALSDLDELQRTLATGYRNPTRFVLLGHSHGTQFAHLLAYERPEIDFIGSVLLDSVCLSWDTDHAESYVRAVRFGPGARIGSGPFSVGCKTVRVPGRYLDHGDAVPANVRQSIEIWSGGSSWSAGLGLVRDNTPNARSNGLSNGLRREVFPWENHEETAQPYSDSFRTAATWLAGVLASER